MFSLENAKIIGLMFRLQYCILLYLSLNVLISLCTMQTFHICDYYHLVVRAFGQVTDGGFGSVKSMALDWITKNIYWTDFRLHRIEVASADGRFRAPLVTENITQPSSIVLDPRPGYVVRRLHCGSVGILQQ